VDGGSGLAPSGRVLSSPTVARSILIPCSHSSSLHTVVPRSLLSRLVGCMKWAGRGDQHFNFEAGIFRDLDLGLGFVEELYCILFSRLKGKMRFENKRLVEL